jgi:hypothetical protein
MPVTFNELSNDGVRTSFIYKDIGNKMLSNVIKNYEWKLAAIKKSTKEIRSGFVSLARLNQISQAHSLKK